VGRAERGDGVRALARRAAALEAEALTHERAIRVIVRACRPDLLELRESDRSTPRSR
jgi:hypothetical protein